LMEFLSPASSFFMETAFEAKIFLHRCYKLLDLTSRKDFSVCPPPLLSSPFEAAPMWAQCVLLSLSMSCYRVYYTIGGEGCSCTCLKTH
jgi:hypothetical protein